jgi:hypothetical protein
MVQMVQPVHCPKAIPYRIAAYGGKVRWKVNVQQDGNNCFLTDDLQSLHYLTAHEHGISFVPQRKIHRPLDDWVVVNHQYFAGRHFADDGFISSRYRTIMPEAEIKFQHLGGLGLFN